MPKEKPKRRLSAYVPNKKVDMTKITKKRDRKHKKMLLEQYIIKQDKELEGLTGWIRGEYEKYRGRENEILPSRVIEKHLSPIKIIQSSPTRTNPKEESKEMVDELKTRL